MTSLRPLGLYHERDHASPLYVSAQRVEAPLATVIAVHGGLDRGRSFARLARRLPHYDLIAYDRRGYQGSRPMGPGTLHEHVSDLKEVIRFEEKPVILVGHSYGGLITLAALADDVTGVVGAVIYESPLPGVVDRPYPLSPATNDPAVAVEGFFKRVVGDDVWRRLSAAEQNSRILDGPALLADFAVLHSPTPVVDCALIQTPLVFGYGDGALRPYYVSIATALQNDIPDLACVEVPDANHGIHLSAPQALANLVDGLVDHVA